MRVLLYEHCTSGGLLDEGDELLDELAVEGRSMLESLAADLALLKGVEPVVLRDHRLVDFGLSGCRMYDIHDGEQIQDAFSRLGPSTAWTVVIAPEFDGILLDLIKLSGWTGRPLAASVDDVCLTSDKQRTAEHLARHDVSVVEGCTADAFESFVRRLRGPYVLKPNEGAGSLGLRKLKRISRTFLYELDDPPELQRIEAFVPGTPASVSFLCGPAGHVALPPCTQRLSDDGTFTYLGGSTPLSPALACRATQLARRAIETLEAPLGWIGVDLVLCEDAAGSGDRVIEINPRLTTSYVGLRAACRENLAEAMLDVAEGRSVSLSFRDERVEFDADGTVRVLQPDGISA